MLVARARQGPGPVDLERVHPDGLTPRRAIRHDAGAIGAVLAACSRGRHCFAGGSRLRILIRYLCVQSTIRSFDLAHLAHVELLSPKTDASLGFFVDVMGMTESGRRGDSVYLRGWDDYEHHTLKLTASKVAGMGHVAFRATSPEALERRAAIIEAAGFGTGWTDGDLGHGPAYSFTTTDGHAMEIYYETEWYTPPPALKPALKNQ